MSNLLEFVFERSWWTYTDFADWLDITYHWINLLEGCAWLVFAALVLRRHVRHRLSRIEWLYALAFVTFGLSDFREAYVVQSWLILFKGLNLVALLWLRRIVIRRFYPQSKTF